MKKFKCECCGAPLRLSITNGEEWICEYCGTKYKQEHEDLPPFRIETFQNPVQTLNFKSCIPDQLVKHMGYEEVLKNSTRKICHEIAENLMPFLRLETEYDPCTMSYIVTGRLRVVEDNYKF